MGSYLLYSILVFCLAISTALFVTRQRWLHRVTLPDYLYSRLPSSFQTDIEEGFSSTTFDLTENLLEGDTRSGLNSTAKKEIRNIMNKRKVNFDEARRIYMQQTFKQNGIGADGRPRDPKFVSFS